MSGSKVVVTHYENPTQKETPQMPLYYQKQSFLNTMETCYEYLNSILKKDDIILSELNKRIEQLKTAEDIFKVVAEPHKRHRKARSKKVINNTNNAQKTKQKPQKSTRSKVKKKTKAKQKKKVSKIKKKKERKSNNTKAIKKSSQKGNMKAKTKVKRTKTNVVTKKRNTKNKKNDKTKRTKRTKRNKKAQATITAFMKL